jgi:hypothetical protein
MRYVAAVTAILLLMAVAAQAGSVVGNFVNVNPGVNTNYHVWWSNDPAHGNPAKDSSTQAGVYNFTIISSDLPWLTTGDNMQAFCIDLNQYCNYNPNTWTIQPLTSAPVPYPNPPGTMTGAQATALQKLFGEGYDLATSGSASTINGQSYTAAQKAAAFQFAVWEIVWEDTSTYDVTANDFRVSGYSNDDAWALANYWLGHLAGQETPPVLALVSETQQDQVILGKGKTPPPIPEPLTMAGLGLGLCGLVGYIRKRRG